MKRLTQIVLAIIILLALVGSGWATDYYVDTASAGGDGTTQELTGAHAAFATIAAAQAAVTGDQSDNSLLFKRGCTWREQFTVGANGTSGHPFTIGAYGEGADSIINGEPVGLWSAGAETGDTSEWTSITQAGTSTFTATTASLFHGNYGFRAFTDGTNYAYATKTITGQTDFYFRYYFYLHPSYAQAADYEYTDFMGLYAGATRKVKGYVQQYPGNVFQFHFQLDFGSYTNYGTASLARGVWHRVDIHYVVSDTVGGFQVWVDGVSLGSKFDENASGDIDTIKLGIISQAPPAANSIIYFDDVKASATSTVAAANAVVLNNKDYITIQNIEVANAGDIGIYLYGGSDHNIIDNVTVRDVGNAVGYESGIFINGGSYNTISNCTVYNVFKGIQNSGYGSVASHYNTITGNTIHNVNDAGIITGPAGGTDPTNTIISGNTIYKCALTVDDRPGIMTFGAGAGIEVTKNHIYDIGTSTIRGEGIEIDTSAVNHSVSYNIIHGCTNGAIGLTGSGHTVYNNVCYNNNTQSYDAGALQIWGNGESMVVKNNVFYGSTGKLLLFADTGNTTGHTIDYNCWYGGSATPFSWDGTSYDFADYKTASSQDGHSLNVDPLMVNPAAGDFHLKPNSLCINAGVDVGLTQDYSGRAVPTGGAPDIGAYESSMGSMGPGF